jgi:hypothetical protein
MMHSLSGKLTDVYNYLLIASYRKKAVSKQHRSLMQRFNLRKLSEMDVRKQYQIKISNRSAALGNLNDSEDKNRACKTLKGTTKPQLKAV